MGLTLLLSGCKPTEKNYKAAYDAARARRETVDADAAVLSGGHKVEKTDAPQVREVEGRLVPYRRIHLKPEEGSGADLTRLPYAVAVAQWRMPTNARSQTSDLIKEGLPAFVAEDTHGKWWTLAGAYADFTEAARAAGEFVRNHPGFSYIGLDGEPVVLCR